MVQYRLKVCSVFLLIVYSTRQIRQSKSLKPRVMALCYQPTKNPATSYYRSWLALFFIIVLGLSLN